MLRREIKYKDFNDEEQVDVAFFHISKTELVEMEVENEGGLAASIQRIIDAKDNKRLVSEFKRVILAAYGVKSPDGKSFIKNAALRDGFAQTAAFDSLFIELATNDELAAKFVQGIIPSDMIGPDGKAMLPPPNIQPVEKAIPAAPSE